MTELRNNKANILIEYIYNFKISITEDVPINWMKLF